MCIYRDIFLTAGNDGLVRLYKIRQRNPVRQWEILPPSIAIGNFPVLCTLTCIRFSLYRPCIFAVCSSEGFVYIFDLSVNTTTAVEVLDSLSASYWYDKQTNNTTTATADTITAADTNNNNNNTTAQVYDTATATTTAITTTNMLTNIEQNTILKNNKYKRNNIQSIAFTQRRRDSLIAISGDGQVYVWRLGPALTTASKGGGDMRCIDELLA